MRLFALSFVVVVCCLVLSSSASAQTPVSDVTTPPAGAESTDPAVSAPAVEPVFEDVPTMNAVGELPAEPEDTAVPTMKGGLDPRAMAETMTNSMIGTGVWDPTLGGQTTGNPEI